MISGKIYHFVSLIVSFFKKDKRFKSWTTFEDENICLFGFLPNGSGSISFSSLLFYHFNPFVFKVICFQNVFNSCLYFVISLVKLSSLTKMDFLGAIIFGGGLLAAIGSEVNIIFLLKSYLQSSSFMKFFKNCCFYEERFGIEIFAKFALTIIFPYLYSLIVFATSYWIKV